MHPNSLKAYNETVLPTLTQREAEVLQALRERGGGTCEEIANFLTRTAGRTVYPNHISGRFRPLEAKGRIAGTTVGGKTVWRPVEIAMQAAQPSNGRLFTLEKSYE